MLRRLFTVLSALSLLLCVAVCVLWVRSYRLADSLEFQRNGLRWRFASEAGRFRLDNEPQRRIEQAGIDRERERCRLEAQRIAQEAEAVVAEFQKRWARSYAWRVQSPDPETDRKEELRMLKAARAEELHLEANLGRLQSPPPRRRCFPHHLRADQPRTRTSRCRTVPPRPR